jgi:hypothetical protein
MMLKFLLRIFPKISKIIQIHTNSFFPKLSQLGLFNFQRTGQFQLWKKNKSELKTRWVYLISRNWEWSGQVKNWQFIGGYLIVLIWLFFQTMFFWCYIRGSSFFVTTMVMRSKNRPNAREGLSRFLIPTPARVLTIHMYYPPTATKCLSYLLMILTHLTTFCLWMWNGLFDN